MPEALEAGEFAALRRSIQDLAKAHGLRLTGRPAEKAARAWLIQTGRSRPPASVADLARVVSYADPTGEDAVWNVLNPGREKEDAPPRHKR